MKSSAHIPALFLCVFATGLSQAAPAPVSRCADCHFANPNPAWGGHLSDWDNSPHGRSGIGCERCHGGDPSTFEASRAHQGILSSHDPASPVHRANLPTTCGSCHPGPLAAFQKSRHYELLRGGSLDPPTCVTCHGSVGAHLLSPKALFAECSRCHGAGKVAQNTDLPAEGRLMLASVQEVQRSLDQTQKLIRQVKDKSRRAELLAELGRAQAPITEAVQSAHRFVFDQMHERLQLARGRADLLTERLANPPPPIRK